MLGTAVNDGRKCPLGQPPIVPLNRNRCRSVNTARLVTSTQIRVPRGRRVQRCAKNRCSTPQLVYVRPKDDSFSIARPPSPSRRASPRDGRILIGCGLRPRRAVVAEARVLDEQTFRKSQSANQTRTTSPFRDLLCRAYIQGLTESRWTSRGSRRRVSMRCVQERLGYSSRR